MVYLYQLAILPIDAYFFDIVKDEGVKFKHISIHLFNSVLFLIK